MIKIQDYSVFVKPQASWKPASFACVIKEKHHIGEPDEIVYLPRCSRCGDLITDLSAANIEATDGEPIPFGELDGIPISILPGNVYFFHKPECCAAELVGPWKSLNTVVRADQRDPWEK
jgi:hypothetical protein